MTPKEKAEELVHKMYAGFVHDLYSYKAKQCAIIAVDEILNNCLFEQYSCGFLTLEPKHEKYWEEVKEELIKL